MDDRDLLQEYVRDGSERAFAELVARHVNLVYAVALRVAGNPQTAQDVAQIVFIRLARKAWLIRDGNALLGWLYRAAYRAAIDALRQEQRRRRRETEAMNLAENSAENSATAERLASVLDEAMQRLSGTEQNALLLRYFEGRSMRETAALLATTESAAQMRVTRAVEKLRVHFARRGIAVPAGVIATALGRGDAQAVPAGVAANLASASLAAPNGWAITLFRILFMSTKTKIMLGAAVVILAATITIVWQNAVRPAVAEPPTVVLQNDAPPAPRRMALADASASLPSPARVALPAVSAAVAPPSGPSSRPSTRELRADLATAIPELLRILEAGDYASMVREFSRPSGRPANMTAEQSAQLMQQDPTFNEQIAALKERLKLIEKMNPVLGASDGAIPIMTATYTLADSASSQEITMVFAKNEEGLWYMESSGWTRSPPRRGGAAVMNYGP